MHKIVETTELQSMIQTLKLLYCAFGEDLFKKLFGELDNISTDKAIDLFIEKLGLEKAPATLLARYMIEPRSALEIQK